MEVFELFKKYHEESFISFKNDLINMFKSEMLFIPKKNICGQVRTQNRGYCRRLCQGPACKYHIKYLEFNRKEQNDDHFIYKSDISNTSEDVIIYKDICKNIISKNIIFNIKIHDLPRSNIILKYDLKADINNYISNLKSKINIFKSFVTFVILYKKIKIKREKKRLKNKKKKEKRKANLLKSNKSVLSDVSKDIPTGILLKEKDIYYTINFYDEKVIADNIEGIVCYYCNSVRYTNSGPCLNPNCFNRSFDDIEFKIYYSKHGKHKESIYNPFLNSKK